MARDRTTSAGGDLLAAAFASAAAIGAAVAGIGMLASGLFGYQEFPRPFAWTDVAVVDFLCSLPFAALCGAAMRGMFPARICLVLAIANWIAIGGLWAIDLATNVVALGGAIGLVLIALSFQTLPASTVPLGIRYLPIALASLAIFIGLPPLYLEARRIHDDRELVDLIDQSRLGEARHLAHQSLILDPQRSIRGQPLREVAIGLDRAVEDLERNVSNPLPASASDEIRLSRARDLAMLGRTREALGELSQSDSLDRSPDAAILRGAILQTREEYASSLAAFERAADLLKPAVPSPDRTAALVAAHSGIAFAHRKLGHNAAAEAAYQRVLALNSSADTHYLLAQFYEGTQQAAKAQFHARQAMALDPDRYSQPGQRLIDKLITHHFGCWGAAAAERNSR